MGFKQYVWGQRPETCLDANNGLGSCIVIVTIKNVLSVFSTQKLRLKQRVTPTSRRVAVTVSAPFLSLDSLRDICIDSGVTWACSSFTFEYWNFAQKQKSSIKEEVIGFWVLAMQKVVLTDISLLPRIPYHALLQRTIQLRFHWVPHPFLMRK